MSSKDTSSRIQMTHQDLFQYLLQAVMCIPDQYKQVVYMGMAHIVMEWRDAPISELRVIFRNMDIPFEELCTHCNEPLPDWEGDDNEDAVCEQCQTDGHD